MKYTRFEIQTISTVIVLALASAFPRSSLIAAEGDAGDTATTAPNKLTDAEKAAGWKLLFDGKTTDGWHNFKKSDVAPGWNVVDGALVCVDPKKAGDIVTADQFDWFELKLEYNISEAGNSGIMFRVTDAGARSWQTGPEVQLEDNQRAADPERCGW